MTDKRPVYLNLFKIRLPTTGIVSFAHRVSGALLFLAIPLCVYLLDRSVSSEQAFEQSVRFMQHPVMQITLLILVWSLVHHFLAGIRYLLLDFDIAVEKASSNISAWTVLIAELLIMLAYVGIVLL
ncbi:MAG: succinate dehydrogenase, cytochrome b556 subunit [Thiotrichales bacterium]|nr:MAG: succinate dehydrogenase, cytochrome b556 subunit [Thiotrichales bacterium]